MLSSSRIAFLLVVSCFALCSVEALTSGTCITKLPVISDFDASQYFGQWYTIERFDYIWEKNLECSRAKYTKIDDKSFTVYNTGVNKDSKKFESVTGRATVTNPTAPNQFLIKLPVVIANITIFENSGAYNVWQTDYKTYSLVYSCTQIIPGLLKSEKAWVLARQPTLDDATLDRVKQILKSQNVNIDQFIKVDQSCQ